MARNSPHVRVTDAMSVRTIELNRPEKVNALSAEMMGALTDALAATGDGIIVLRAAGSRGFCSGADLGSARKGGADVHALDDAMAEMMVAFAACKVPVVTLVHGSVLGAGVAIAAMSDVVMADSETQFRMPEIEFGVYPAPMHAILARVLPAPMVRQICTSGRSVSAAEALSAGLATEVLSLSDTDRVELRISFYRDRAQALLAGRTMKETPAIADFAAQMRDGSALFHRQFETDAVQRILARYRA